MIVRDARMREIKQGQTVLLKWGDQTVEGVVAEVKAGGIITGLRDGGKQIAPVEVKIDCSFTIAQDPTKPIHTVYVLQQDEDVQDKLVSLQ